MALLSVTKLVWLPKEIFAPIAKMTTVRTLISVAAVRSWPLY
ncbi:hypothetical protein CsSME_00021383 [Camellia sinensis var. sinensis]